MSATTPKDIPEALGSEARRQPLTLGGLAGLAFLLWSQASDLQERFDARKDRLDADLKADVVDLRGAIEDDLDQVEAAMAELRDKTASSVSAVEQRLTTLEMAVATGTARRCTRDDQDAYADTVQDQLREQRTELEALRLQMEREARMQAAADAFGR